MTSGPPKKTELELSIQLPALAVGDLSLKLLRLAVLYLHASDGVGRDLKIRIERHLAKYAPEEV